MLGLTPVLTSAHLIFERQTDRVVDVTSDAGTLWQKDPPVLRLLEEPRPQQHHPRDLFIADSAAVPLLRQLHLPVVTMAGLDQMSGPQMRRLCARQSDEHPYFRLVLVAWDFANVTNGLTEFAKRVLQRIYDWHVARSHDPENVVVHGWVPRGKRFELLRTAIEFRDVQLLKQKIHASVRADTRNAVDVWQTFLDSRKSDLPTIVRSMRTQIAQAHEAPNRRDARLAAKAFRDRHNEFINAYYRSAEGARHPAEVLHFLILAQEHEDFLRDHPLLMAVDQIAANEPLRAFQRLDPSTTVLRDHQIARILRLANAVTAKKR